MAKYTYFKHDNKPEDKVANVKLAYLINIILISVKNETGINPVITANVYLTLVTWQMKKIEQLPVENEDII